MDSNVKPQTLVGTFDQVQERIKGTEKASPIHTHSIVNSSRVIFKTTDPKGD